MLPDPTPEALALVADGTLTVRQATAEWGLSRSELYRLMDAGELAYIPYGVKRTRLIPRQALRRYMARHATAALVQTSAPGA